MERSWDQFPPGVRTVRVVDSPALGDTPRFRLQRYAWPWVSIYRHSPVVFFHNEPWKTETEASDLNRKNQIPCGFCHAGSENGVCLGNSGLFVRGIANRFWFSNFSDYTDLHAKELWRYVNKGLGCFARSNMYEITMMEVLRDIEHPDRILKFNFAKTVAFDPDLMPMTEVREILTRHDQSIKKYQTP